MREKLSSAAEMPRVPPICSGETTRVSAVLMIVFKTPVVNDSGISTSSSTGTLGVNAHSRSAGAWITMLQKMSLLSEYRLLSRPTSPACTMTDSKPT